MAPEIDLETVREFLAHERFARLVGTTTSGVQPGFVDFVITFAEAWTSISLDLGIIEVDGAEQFVLDIWPSDGIPLGAGMSDPWRTCDILEPCPASLKEALDVVPRTVEFFTWSWLAGKEIEPPAVTGILVSQVSAVGEAHLAVYLIPDNPSIIAAQVFATGVKLDEASFTRLDR